MHFLIEFIVDAKLVSAKLMYTYEKIRSEAGQERIRVRNLRLMIFLIVLEKNERGLAIQSNPHSLLTNTHTHIHEEEKF